MKQLLFILLMLPCCAVGQQLLWSTTESEALKDFKINLITVERVTETVMDYYDIYDYYYDLTGFSRGSFKTFLENNVKAANSIQLDGKMMFDKPTAFAFKTNDGRGSIVVVVFIQEENLDIILFSNNLDKDAKSTTASEREKFNRWFSSFWNYSIAEKGRQGDTLVPNYVEWGSGNDSLSQNRMWIVPPRIEDNGQHAGVVMVEIHVARDGRITYARAGVKGTTIPDRTLWERCERAVRLARLNEIEGVLSVQKRLIPFRFRLK